MSGFRLFCTIQDANGEAMAVAPVNHRQLSLIEKAGHYDLRVEFPTLWLKPGVYSVFFKLLAMTAGTGKARFISDSTMLDVSGNSDPELMLGCMTPEAKWSAESVTDKRTAQVAFS